MGSPDPVARRRRRAVLLAHAPAQARGRTVHPHEAPRRALAAVTGEVPPELAMLLDTVEERALGVNRSAASRAGIVRAGLILYLEATANPPVTAIDATAEVEEADVPELPPTGHEGEPCRPAAPEPV